MHELLGGIIVGCAGFVLGMVQIHNCNTIATRKRDKALYDLRLRFIAHANQNAVVELYGELNQEKQMHTNCKQCRMTGISGFYTPIQPCEKATRLRELTEACRARLGLLGPREPQALVGPMVETASGPGRYNRWAVYAKQGEEAFALALQAQPPGHPFVVNVAASESQADFDSLANHLGSLIVGRRVVTLPGAGIEVTELTLSEPLCLPGGKLRWEEPR